MGAVGSIRLRRHYHIGQVQNPVNKLRTDWSRLLGWLAVLVVAVGMFVVRIGHEPLWLDETYSLAMVQHGFVDIIRLTTKDVHPPLYYLFLKLSTVLFGTSLAALRLPSALAAIALLALGAFPVRRIWGDRTAYLFGALVATSPGVVCFAQEARMYTLSAFCVTSAVLYGFLALVEGKRRDFVWFGLFTWAAAMSHYFALVAAGMNCLVLMAMARGQYRSRAKPLVLTSLAAGVAFSPWLVPFGFQLARVSHGFWIPQTNLNLFTFQLVAPFAYKFEDIPYPWQALVALLLAVTVILATVAIKAWRGPTIAFRARTHLGVVFLLTLGFGLGFSRLVQPVLMPRYMMVCAGLLLLATAAATASLPSPRWNWVVAGSIIGLGLPAVYRIERETFNGPFDSLAERVRREGESSPVLLHNDLQSLYPSLHALPNAQHVLLTKRGESFDVLGSGVYADSHLTSSSDLAPLLAPRTPVWVVDTNPSGFHVDATQIVATPGWRQVGDGESLELPMSWVKLRLLRFEFGAGGTITSP